MADIEGLDEHTVGILTIGSLFWDERPHRESWRGDRLQMKSAIPVEVPIRYGRRSMGRKDTYTMVFSNALLSAKPPRTGWALVVPCRRTVSTAAQLVNEAQALWAAEQSSLKPLGPLSADWGAVGLLQNPDQPTLSPVVNGWSKRVTKEKRYARFPKARNEKAAVDSNGLLTIQWPTDESGNPLQMDLLLATATVPTFTNKGFYPSAETIAAEWNREPPQRGYFDKNRGAGITTADDSEIMKHLGDESSTKHH